MQAPVPTPPQRPIETHGALRRKSDQALLPRRTTSRSRELARRLRARGKSLRLRTFLSILQQDQSDESHPPIFGDPLRPAALRPLEVGTMMARARKEYR